MVYKKERQQTTYGDHHIIKKLKIREETYRSHRSFNLSGFRSIAVKIIICHKEKR